MRQQRWIEYFKDYDCMIEYSAGKGNLVTDALSQKYTSMVLSSDQESSTSEGNDSKSFSAQHDQWQMWEGESIYTLEINTLWLNKVKEAQDKDPEKAIGGRETWSYIEREFQYRQGMLYYQGRLDVSDVDKLKR